MKFQPHPPWSTIFRSFLSSSKALENPWAQPGYDLHFTARSTASFLLLSRWFQKRHGKPATWYFPEYICNAQILALQNVGDKIIFYAITENLEPDWASLKGDQKGFFVSVQYFGIEKILSLANQFCIENDLYHVEDAVHLLRKKQKVIADFVLFSPYKTLGLPFGAVLLSKKEHESIASYPSPPKISKNDIEWILKRAVEDLTPASLLDFQKKRQMPNDPFFDYEDIPKETSLSSLSLSLMSISSEYLAREAAARSNNYKKWKTALDAHSLSEAWKMSDVEAPYLFPVRFESYDKALENYKKWNQSRWLLQTWPHLPKEIPEASFARVLKKTILFLPTHSAIKAQQLIFNN